MFVIHNAKIHTFNPAQELASAMAVDGGTIRALGSNDEILSTFSTTNRLNAEGRTIIPGLTDAHIHFEELALNLQKVNCEVTSRQECLQRVAERVISTPPGEWILGHGWNQNNWPEGYGTAQLLDDISPNNPVYLTHKSLHSGWVNMFALHLLGIDRNTPDPENGRISHLQNGDPDGILFESAMGLVENRLPEPSINQVVEAFRSTQPTLWKMGLTGLHDFDRSRCFSALQVMHHAGELKFRIVKSIPIEDLQDAISIGLRTGFGDDMLRIGSVKLFSDGALGPHTAAMFQPYEDDPNNLGWLMLSADELFEHGRLASSNGISLAVHAIGDRANHEVLNAFTRLRSFEDSLPSISPAQLRHRIEHVQIIEPADVSRLRELNIIASMQPIHATSDMQMADQYWGKRASHSYTWREQLNHGNALIFGSDAPVETPNPFAGIHAAVTRRRPDGSPSQDGWYPEQRLSIKEALHAYTVAPAFASHREDRLGKLAPGYLADLIIINKNPFSCPPAELREIHSLATMVGGEWVFSELM